MPRGICPQISSDEDRVFFIARSAGEETDRDESCRRVPVRLACPRCAGGSVLDLLPVSDLRAARDGELKHVVAIAVGEALAEAGLAGEDGAGDGVDLVQRSAHMFQREITMERVGGSSRARRSGPQIRPSLEAKRRNSPVSMSSKMRLRDAVKCFPLAPRARNTR